MKKTLTVMAAIFTILFAVSGIAWLRTKSELCQSMTLTFGITAYQLRMRLIVGGIAVRILKNEVNYKSAWFKERNFEQKLYNKIGIKKLKKQLPSYEPKLFDIKIRSTEELLKAGCQAEIVHEIIMLLSLAPILLCIWFDPNGVFIITSILAVMTDGLFTAVQRYNRARLRKIMKRRESKWK